MDNMQHCDSQERKEQIDCRLNEGIDIKALGTVRLALAFSKEHFSSCEEINQMHYNARLSETGMLPVLTVMSRYYAQERYASHLTVKAQIFDPLMNVFILAFCIITNCLRFPLTYCNVLHKPCSINTNTLSKTNCTFTVTCMLFYDNNH